MAFRCTTKFYSKFLNKNIITHANEYVRGSRRFAAKPKKSKKKEDPCPNRTCKQGEEEKKSFWRIFKGNKEPPPKPPLETCRKHIAERMRRPDPDLSSLGGTPYRTCGPAYIIQKDLLPKAEITMEPEDKIIEKIEKHPDLKNIADPMPPFESVEQRLIHLSEKKLHPLYRRYLAMPPRKPPKITYPKFQYKSRSGPVTDEEIPAHLKLTRDNLNKKNIYSEFKRAEPPRQLLAKMLEMKQNQRPTLEKKKDVNQQQPKQIEVLKAMKIK